MGKPTHMETNDKTCEYDSYKSGSDDNYFQVKYEEKKCLCQQTKRERRRPMEVFSFTYSKISYF
jgi:hypothetical protein